MSDQFNVDVVYKWWREVDYSKLLYIQVLFAVQLAT